MRLILEAAKTSWRAGEPVTARLIVLNDGYEAVAFDRRLLVGPNFASALFITSTIGSNTSANDTPSSSATFFAMSRSSASVLL